MKFQNQIITTFIFVCLNFFPANSQIQTASGRTLSPGTLDSFLLQKMEELKMPGLSIAIFNNNEIVYTRALGVTNTASGQPLSDKTIFEAASLSKPLFAYFTFKMIEKGLLDLDTPLYQYLPNPELDHDERYKQITARQVLSHTTGLPNWRYMTNKMMYLELLSTPGEQFSYSGEAYEYLANVIAHLSEGTLGDLENLLQQQVLQPLKMKQSSFVWNANMEVHKAHGHAMPNLPNNRFKPLLARVAGGLHSNATDYARFLIALLTGEGLAPASLDALLAPKVTLPEDHDIRNSYGVEEWTLGFARQNTPFGIKHSHGGNNVDFQSYFEFYKERALGYVFMTNCSKGDEFNIELNELLTLGQLAPPHKAYEIVNRKMAPITEAEYEGCSLNARTGTGFAWLKNTCFSEGSIEFDVRGNNQREKSFVGIAFHAQDNTTYDCIYFRPYLFQTQNEVETNYMIQYISMPKYDWFNLRSAYPGQFEGRIEDAPAPEDWFHVKLDLKDNKIAVYVNHQKQPALVTEKMNSHTTGKVGFWMGNLSKGDFANLKITDK